MNSVLTSRGYSSYILVWKLAIEKQEVVIKTVLPQPRNAFDGRNPSYTFIGIPKRLLQCAPIMLFWWQSDMHRACQQRGPRVDSIARPHRNGKCLRAAVGRPARSITRTVPLWHFIACLVCIGTFYYLSGCHLCDGAIRRTIISQQCRAPFPESAVLAIIRRCERRNTGTVVRQDVCYKIDSRCLQPRRWMPTGQIQPLR